MGTTGQAAVTVASNLSETGQPAQTETQQPVFVPASYQLMDQMNASIASNGGTDD